MICPHCGGRVAEGGEAVHFIRHHAGTPVDASSQRRAQRLAMRAIHRERRATYA